MSYQSKINFSTIKMSVTITLVLIILIIYLVNKKYSYWKLKNVVYETPLPIFGNFLDYILLKKHYFEVVKKLCGKFKNEKYFGTYYGTEPALVILDPELIKLVLTKDFYYFNSRELMDYTNREITTQTLFFQHGDHWKIVRQNLTPLFSSMKLKNMFYLIENCNYVLENVLDKEYSENNTIDAKLLMIKYTMDCICSCVFGFEGNVMQCKDSPFTKMGEIIFTTSKLSGLKLVFRNLWPNLFYSLGLKYFPTEIDMFFKQLLIGIFESRNYEPSQRNDFVDLLLNLKKNNYIFGDNLNSKTKLQVDDDLMVAQCVGFFGAGFETSASVSSATLYELAKNESAQRKVHEEIDNYLHKHNNKLSYDCYKELPYLEACVHEVMRMYPVLGVINREVYEDYELPTGLKLERGLRVHLPVYYLHNNPDNFPNPEQFVPERFLPGAVNEIKPYTYFPFGEGPRSCIGMRFAKMQVFPGLVTFLKKFNVKLAESTPRKLRITPTAFLLQPSDCMKLQWNIRDGWEQRVYVK